MPILEHSRPNGFAYAILTTCLAISPLMALEAWSLEPSLAGAAPLSAALVELDNAVQSEGLEERVIAWRRDIHEHPELSNREFRTAGVVEKHLRALGLEVRTGIAHTGVVGVLRGALPGPTVALRADMDALPVTEETGLPFASKVKTEYNGSEVGVMHACGHDAHTAILMGAAEVLASLREVLRGSVVFVFQPAEEGAPAGEEGGAAMMIREGVLETEPRPEAIFGLHVWPERAGTIGYRERGTLAASDWLRILVRGKQTHGSSPWRGIDPIVVSAQILTALQTIPSRQLDITNSPAVVTIGKIQAGVRGNIIPDEAEMLGTIRTFDRGVREELLSRIRRTVTQIAEASGAEAEVEIDSYAPVTYNDPDLTRATLPSLRWAAGDENVHERPLITGAEDFAFFQEEIPGFYFILGVNREGVGAGEAASNHSPMFFVNEDALMVGVRALSRAAVDYLERQER